MRKYRNVKCEMDGLKFDSKREMAYYQELKLRKKAGDIKFFSVKPILKIISYKKMWPTKRREQVIGYVWGRTFNKKEWNLLFSYTPDFVVDGEVVDVKGFITPEFRLKAKILAALGMPVKIVK